MKKSGISKSDAQEKSRKAYGSAFSKELKNEI